MTLSSKQRAQLRGIAMTEDTIIQIGKAGITENTVTEVNNALAARELIKGRVLENSLLTAAEAANALAEACGAETVQVIGSKFVLFKRNIKEPKIELVKSRKK
ncbi:MAG: YhbY family RNA-binding protein [Clostridia bacterium]|nr:YhbY family RNA-binding protein [Oscillospiraceae bacterium]MCI6973117.1 YhbY family RNA-binding protein [Clostridiales bacterium]MDO4354415.1 YhbY family RNA-binding protein [Clostridia bacterium]MDY2909055.1 YhbY family RNA-binding protein [Oscillospiraceae bacterium]